MLLIVLVGRLIEANHCVIHYHEGEVTLVPAEGAMCYVDSNRVFEQTKLSQGKTRIKFIIDVKFNFYFFIIAIAK